MQKLKGFLILIATALIINYLSFKYIFRSYFLSIHGNIRYLKKLRFTETYDIQKKKEKNEKRKHDP